MGILDKIKSFLPKKKEPELKNNVPKEKENIRKTFGVYCRNNHGTEGDKLCPKCTALLTTVFTKIGRCPYGIGKPICDKCETPCFGENATKEFRNVMSSSQRKMLMSHPMMTIKHKLQGLGVDYAKQERDKKSTDKQKQDEEKIKNKINNAMKSPKSSKTKAKSKAKKKKK
ncbi:MAG: nitrous oxide-stimulated promoter family protein [Selenomonadaceae bacterium]|nr:nitrous oxide-stimulated promoter family protein [Selenomonadaceae bacterium]